MVLTYNNKKKKNWRMRILGARIFLSFLAGKLKIFNRGYKGKSLHKNWRSNLAKCVEFEFDTTCWRKTNSQKIKQTELSTVLRKQSWRTWILLTFTFYLCFELDFELSDLVLPSAWLWLQLSARAKKQTNLYVNHNEMLWWNYNTMGSSSRASLHSSLLINHHLQNL